MRIGIGAVLGITGGPATYARELISALVRAAGHEYVVFTDRPDAFAGLDVDTASLPLDRTYQQVTWDHVALPRLIARERIDLYHGTKSILPWRLPVPGVVTVHDLAVYAMPETFAAPQRWHFRLFVPPSVRRAARVIADSEHAKRELAARFGLDPARIPVVPLGVRSEMLVRPPDEAITAFRGRHGLAEHLVVCVGTLQPRKRVERVVEAFVRSGAARRGWQLVIAGRTRPGYSPPWLTAPPAGVLHVGPLADDDLVRLYAAAEIAMSGSDYEGFGLTVCEAMAGGCAVVAVNATSIPEVTGDAALLVDASDAGLLAQALARLIDDPALRCDLGARACARASRFTWDETARRTRVVYDEVLACRP